MPGRAGRSVRSGKVFASSIANDRLGVCRWSRREISLWESPSLTRRLPSLIALKQDGLCLLLFALAKRREDGATREMQKRLESSRDGWLSRLGDVFSRLFRPLLLNCAGHGSDLPDASLLVHLSWLHGQTPQHGLD